ncbi:JmjC domain-containing protein [Erythrobacter sp. MTPC3]|uniref:JmjC domain-containing protein n=1 Tax=Erythrobacter sp. MTPC3 TaxID=3056564 RepID=UPI0036F44910
MKPTFQNFDVDAFLRDYWQKKPLFMRNPWRDWQNPLEPDELAGLACEPQVESRVVAQSSDTLTLEQGPFAENRFEELGTAPWTLLVQAVDHFTAEVSDLIEPFRFIPNWRIDDVMVSFATDGGGVGAHFDQYDVFLVQGLGQRRWEIGQMCDENTALLPHDDLKLLAEFEPSAEWVLGPGDILYIPPGLAHKGTAIGHDCMTYSIGFRAPSRSELVEGFAADLLQDMSEDDRYGDPDLTRQGNPGEITADALARLHSMVMRELGDADRFSTWFGSFATEPKNAHIDWAPEESIDLHEVVEALTTVQTVLRNPASRFAFIRRDDGGVTLMVDGKGHVCTGEASDFAQRLCRGPRFEMKAGSGSGIAHLLHTLINDGSAAFEIAED